MGIKTYYKNSSKFLMYIMVPRWMPRLVPRVPRMPRGEALFCSYFGILSSWDIWDTEPGALNDYCMILTPSVVPLPAKEQ